MEVQSCFVFNQPKIDKQITFAKYMCEQFQNYGDRIALANADTKEEWKFSELGDWIETAVGNLCSLFNVTPESRIAFAALNCPEIIILQLSCSALGLPCIALNARATVDELLHQLQVSEATHVFTQVEFEAKLEKVKEQFSNVKFNTVALLSTVVAAPNSNESSESAMVGKISESHIIYFSSGTTGLPKAVQVTHQSIITNAHQMSSIHLKTETGNEQESFLAQLPFHHLYGTMIAYWCLYSGTKCVTMAKYTSKPYLQALQDYKISILHTVPPLVQMLAFGPEVDHFNLSSLKSIASCGAPLDPEIAKACVQRLKLLDLRQLFGMTEVLTVCWSASGDKNYRSTGKLVPGIICRIVDPETRTLNGPMKEGEICVRGPAISAIYFKNAQATADLYDEDGFIKTGDLGFYDLDGYIYIVDRLKDIIKYKGTQLSPSEIEKILRSHPAVLDCTVLGKPDRDAGELPTAFVVKSEDPVTPEELQAHVKGKVSSYKELKGGVYFVDSIPKTPSGKVLKRELMSKL